MKTNGVKGVVIPLTENTGIAIESRRRLGFDNHLGLQSSGTLVYTIDTRITHPYSAYKLVPPARSTDREWERDTPLKVNESVTTNGWKITVLESGSFGDVVKVENVGGELATKAPVSKPRAISPGCNNRCGAKPNLVAPEFVSNEWVGNVYKLVLKVASIAQGAFIEIKTGVEGLVHVSEMSWSSHLRNPSEYLKVGDEVLADEFVISIPFVFTPTNVAKMVKEMYGREFESHVSVTSKQKRQF
jgi:hypothetical protein